MNTPNVKTFKYYCGGYFALSFRRTYVSEKLKKKCDCDINLIVYFDMLDDLKD